MANKYTDRVLSWADRKLLNDGEYATSVSVNKAGRYDGTLQFIVEYVDANGEDQGAATISYDVWDIGDGNLDDLIAHILDDDLEVNDGR